MIPFHNDTLSPIRTFAAEAHAEKGQTYGAAARPYAEHLAHVEEVLRRFGATIEKDMELLSAAWLHDIVEDCNVSYAILEQAFGKRVAELVWAVTNAAGKNRKERHEKTYPKTRAIDGATRLKLADRIANVEASLSEMKMAGQRRSSFLDMYKKEHPEFRNALHKEGENEDLWRYLDELLG